MSDQHLTKYLSKSKVNEAQPIVSIQMVPKKAPAKPKAKQPTAPVSVAGKRKTVKLSQPVLEGNQPTTTVTVPKIPRVDAEDSRLAEQAFQISKLQAEIKQYQTENLSKVQVSSSSLSNLKQPNIHECNNTTASMPVHYDTHSTNNQQPSSALMVTLFEYEMRLQHARASADVDRMKAEARINSERVRSEQERSRADLSDMRLRMFSALNR